MVALALLVGRAPSYLKVRGGSLYRLGIPRVTTGLPSELLFQRPDIRAAEAALATADANVEAARAAFFPSITLTGQYGVVSTALKNLFTPQAIFYQVAAGLAQPVFDGFRLEGLFEQAKGRQLELLEDLSQVDRVRLRRRGAGPDRDRRYDRARAAAAGRWSLPRGRAFQIAETRLREGTVDLSPCCMTQQTLFTAEDNRVEARLARLQAVLEPLSGAGRQLAAARRPRALRSSRNDHATDSARPCLPRARGGRRRLLGAVADRPPSSSRRGKGGPKDKRSAGQSSSDPVPVLAIDARTPTCRSISTASAPPGRSTPSRCGRRSTAS